MSRAFELCSRVLGLSPRLVRLPDGRELPCVAPNSEGQAAEILHLARAEGLVVLPRGNASRLAWAPLPKRVDLLLSTEHLAGVIAHEPGDGTITALAGTPWSELAVTAARSGHALAPDVPHPASSTLGGVLSVGVHGPDRFTNGPARDHVLGMRVLLGDGRAARSGGRLVKNVTGYDLHKLFVGAHGTLGLIVEATLRLLPAPAERALIEARFTDSGAAFAKAKQLRDEVPNVRTLCLDAVNDVLTLTLELAGSARSVAASLDLAAARLENARLLSGTAARIEAEQRRDRTHDPRSTFIELDVRPSRALAAWRQLRLALSRIEERGRLHAEPALARLTAVCPELDGDDVRSIHSSLTAEGLAPRFRDLAPELGRALNPEPPGAKLMRSLERALDPHSVFPKGRLIADRVEEPAR